MLVSQSESGRVGITLLIVMLAIAAGSLARSVFLNANSHVPLRVTNGLRKPLLETAYDCGQMHTGESRRVRLAVRNDSQLVWHFGNWSTGRLAAGISPDVRSIRPGD